MYIFLRNFIMTNAILCGGKFLNPCVGWSVGKLVWSVSSCSENVN